MQRNASSLWGYCIADKCYFIENNMENDCGFTFCPRYGDIMMHDVAQNPCLFIIVVSTFQCRNFLQSYIKQYNSTVKVGIGAIVAPTAKNAVSKKSS